MTTKVEDHSSGVEDSAEEEVGSPSLSIGSSSSGFSVSGIIRAEKDSKTNEAMPSTSRSHLPLIVQKEMSKLFAARCDATQLDLIPFKVVMDIIREHFILSNKPELLRVLIRLLCQYQPLQGEKEYKKLTSLCEDLLITVDEEVRDAFLAMIPVPIEYRHNFLPQTNVVGCGHYVRNSGRKEDTSNPLAELVKRPLLSYQTMPAPLFQQPFIKPPGNIQNRSANLDQTKDPYKYFNFSGTSITDITKSESEMLNKTSAHSSMCHSSWMGSASTALPMSASNNSLMWFARTNSQSPMHSPTGRHQTGNARHSLLTASLMPNLSKFNQYDTKKQLIQHSAMNSALLPSNFPMSCLNAAPNYCELRTTNANNLDLSRHPCTITSDIATAYLDNRMDQDNSCYLEQLLKRPETPDCSDPWGNGKKSRRQNKPCAINSLMSRKKKKSKK